MRNVKTFFCTLFIMTLIPSFAVAGGLDEATSSVQTLIPWLYGLFCGCVVAYMGYQVFLAKIEKQTYGDVINSIGNVAIAVVMVLIVSLIAWAWPTLE